MRRLRPFLLLLLCWLALPAAAADHVRVVLDTSLSMAQPLVGGGGRNDTGRLAVLATALLFDLARPNTTLGSSFAVIPFDQDWPAWQTSEPEPRPSRRPILRAESGRRDAFLKELQALAYDSPMTYFHPVLLRALDDLPPPSAADRVRVIVLVTDGVPEPDTRERELALMRERLLPRLTAARVRLYVLAFGNDALRYRGFFDQLMAEAKGAAGGLIPAQGAKDLLDGMVQIFSRSFGYAADEPRPVAALADLDLAGGVSPERAIALVMTASAGITATGRDAAVPKLKLTPPAGASLNAPDGPLTAAVPGGAYSLLHVLNPAPGRFQLTSDGAGTVAAVLRPTRLALQVLPDQPGGESGRAMVGRPLTLRVRVSPASGEGDPGPVNLSFRLLGERLTGADGSPGHAYIDDYQPPVDSSGEPAADGRYYRIIANFRADRVDPMRSYLGFIELRAMRGEAVVGELSGDRAHPVRVEPLRSLFRPRVESVDLDFGTLTPGSPRCLPFDPAAEHFGEVPLELLATRRLPPGFELWVQLAREELRPGAAPVASVPGDRYALCVQVAADARASRLTEDGILRLQVAGSKEPAEGIGLRVSWEAAGLSALQFFWRRWWGWILAAFGLGLLTVLGYGLFGFPRFPERLGLVYVERAGDLAATTSVPLRNYRGTGAGWMRPARAYLHYGLEVSGRGRGALARIEARNGSLLVAPAGAALFYELDANDWVEIGSSGRAARPSGESYRIGQRGPFFRFEMCGRH